MTLGNAKKHTLVNAGRKRGCLWRVQPTARQRSLNV